MLLRPCSRRALQPLSWISRPGITTMPLRAKIQNSTVSQTAKMGEEDDVLFGSIYGVRSVELNRPKKLNSLNESMASKIVPRLQEWEKSDMANVVIMSGAGKALCAGGDVGALAEDNKTGEKGQQRSADYFALEYQLDHLIATYSKPYISYMDGFTMGGGVGLSVHAPFRIATENTVFAMPETKIGFFPDVGGSFFLPRLDGYTGRYLALTSENLKGVQAYYAGIGTHYIHSSNLQDLTARLSELNFEDSKSYAKRLELINATIDEFSSGVPHDQAPLLSGERRKAIDRCFRHDKMEDIFAAVRQEQSNPDQNISKWAQDTEKTMLERSPTSLKVTLRQMILGRKWKIAEAFQKEHLIASRFMRHPDFVEGVEVVLKKLPRKPEWQPAKLDQITDQAVDEFFSFKGNKAVELLSSLDYAEYGQHDFEPLQSNTYGLPTERTIKQNIQGGQFTAQKFKRAAAAEYGTRAGWDVKVNDILERKCKTNENGILVWED